MPCPARNSSRSVGWLATICAAGVLAPPAPLAAQTTDASGARQRTAGALLRRDARPPSRSTTVGVSLHQHDGPAGRVLVADNRAYGPMQIAVYLAAAGDPGGARLVGGLRVVPPRTEAELWVLAEGSGPDDYTLQQIPGDPAARHAPAEPYRLPYAVGSRYVVSQAFPERVTHLDRSSEHAIDFEMPVGTEVYAARAGLVMEVAGDYYGVDVPADASLPANLVRVLHDDGTMAVYAHLQWNSIRVEPGQRIARGGLLARSGNTGFSTGPHLHFVVQRNRGGFVVSVPVEFAGPDGGAVSLRADDAPAAY